MGIHARVRVCMAAEGLCGLVPLLLRTISVCLSVRVDVELLRAVGVVSLPLRHLYTLKQGRVFRPGEGRVRRGRQPCPVGSPASRRTYETYRVHALRLPACVGGTAPLPRGRPCTRGT